MPRRNVLRLACLALFAGCNGPDATGPAPPPAAEGLSPPGYYGDLPSPRALNVLATLIGASVADTSGAFGGGRWTVGKLVVVPNPVSAGGKGPVVPLEQKDQVFYLPVEADGDVADLYRHVARTRAPGPARRAERRLPQGLAARLRDTDSAEQLRTGSIAENLPRKMVY